MRKITGPNFVSGGRTMRGERVPWPREVPSSRASLALGPKPCSYCCFLEVGCSTGGEGTGADRGVCVRAPARLGVVGSREVNWGEREVTGSNGTVTAEPGHGYTCMDVSKWLCETPFVSHLNRNCTMG